MTILHTDASASWQSRIVYIAAALFTLASGAINVIYGWQKGTDLPTSLVWSAVSLAVSAVFAFSWPALLISLDRKQWTRVPILLVALLVTGTYSVSAALGSASGGRTNAAAKERSTTDARNKAQKAYDDAQAELAAIPPSRPTTELQVLITAAEAELAALPATRSVAQMQQLLAQRFGQDCAAVNGSLQVVCPRAGQWQAELNHALQRQKLSTTIADLRAELARSERRQKLKEDAEAAVAKIERVGVAKKSNTDADAVATYLQALGINVQPDTVNRLLVLLAVIMIECGGGLALAVGMALNDPAVRSVSADRVNVQGNRTLSERPNAGVNDHARPSAEKLREIIHLDRSPALDDRPERSAHDRVLSVLNEKGGVLFGSQGVLGASFGWSKSRMNEVLHELEAAGRVKLQTSRQGTAVRLVGGTA